MRIPFWPRKSNKTLLNICIEQIAHIRENSDVLAICATPTGYSWLGVNVATKSLFPQNTFEIPQYFANSILTNDELDVLLNHIYKKGFKQVIYSGFAPFYKYLVLKLYGNVVQKVIYHGFISEFSEIKGSGNLFFEIVELTRSNKIQSIGFVKKGLALTIKQLYQIPCFEIILPNNNIVSKPPEEGRNLNIGCFVNNSFRKNLQNQIIASLLIENSLIHVVDKKGFNYLDSKRIVEHGPQKHDQFLTLLGSMSINLHITLSESWGQILSESISLGVPCLASYSSSFFDYDDELKSKLIVEGFDDSWHIYNKIEQVLKEREYLCKKCIRYAHILNNLSKKKLKVFLNN